LVLFIAVLEVDVAKLCHIIIIAAIHQWHHSLSACVTAAVHIVTEHRFWLMLALITFTSTFTTLVVNSNTVH